MAACLPFGEQEPLTCAQVRAVDRLAGEQYGLSGLVLMENAGRGAAEHIWPLLPDPRRNRVAILCGSGNNGGDGLVIARHLAVADVPVELILTAPPERLSRDAAVNARIAAGMQLPLTVAETPEAARALAERLDEAEVIVDALLGTGVSGAPRGAAAALITLANAAERPRRVAIDIPSGLDADRGVPHAPCFRADLTLTFVASKVGFSSVAAQAVTGRVVVVGIGVPPAVVAAARIAPEPAGR